MKNLLAVWLLSLWSVCPVAGRTDDSILAEVSVLTIHVNDANTHAAVFHFLTNVLKLPVEYGPEMMGQRRYAAVYAGNLSIEPCGPYSNMRYPTRDFQALFFGLNCSSHQSPAALAGEFARRKIPYTAESSDSFRIQDAALEEGLYLAVSSANPKLPVSEKETAWRAALAANHRTGLGFEYVAEIWLGYTDPSQLRAWKEFLGPAGWVTDTLWRLDKNQRLRFVKSQLRGVQAIVCKVRSLAEAEAYLKQTGTFGRRVDGRLELDKARTCGLSIYMSGDH